MDGKVDTYNGSDCKKNTGRHTAVLKPKFKREIGR